MLSPIAIAILVVLWVLRIYTWVLWLRFILDWVLVLARGFRPRGFLLGLFEVVFSVTDPPIKFFRRIVPPIRLGAIALDLGWLLTMFSCWILLALLPLIPV